MLGQRNNMRQSERRNYGGTSNLSVSVFDTFQKKTVNLKARTVDVSPGGIGLETDYPLASGQKLWLHGTDNRVGIVRWQRKLDRNYRVGVQMLVTETDSTRKSFSDDVLSARQERAQPEKLLDEAADRLVLRLSDLERESGGEHVLSAVKTELDRALEVCGAFEAEARDHDAIRQARTRFHAKTDAVLSGSYLVKRARTWPQGYQGDYKTLETIYANTPRSQGLGYHLDLLGLSAPLAAAVRNRIKELALILGKELSERKAPSVLNIACGSCRELMAIAPEIMMSGARLTCIDTDNDALAFAQDRLSYAGVIEQVELRKYNALRMFDEEMNLLEFGPQDIIYSVGLFDYLPDDFLIKLMKALYSLLRPGGKLVAAFKDADRYRSQDYHWICDWDGFLQRREDDFVRILSAAGIPDNLITTTREESGVIVFYTATRMKD